MPTDTTENADSKSHTKLSSREDFDRAVGLTRSLIEAEGLWWKLSASAAISPRLDDEIVARIAGAKETPEREKFERILSGEIVPALNRAAKTPAFGDPVSGKDANKDDKREFRSRAKSVGEHLLTPGLRERVLVRKTSKGPSLEELRWDISIKKHDLRTGTVPDIPYATIELVLVTEPADSPFALLGLGARRDICTFDCHLGDLDSILRDLEALRQNLRKLTEAGR